MRHRSHGTAAACTLLLVGSVHFVAPVMARPKPSEQASPIAATQDREAAVARLIRDLQSPLAARRVQKVAVLDLTDLDGNCSALGRFLAEELTTGLASAGGVEVVERNRLRQVLDDLNEFAAPEPETYKTLQQSLGVDAAVVGTLTPLGNKTKINVRVITTDTGRVVNAASQEFAMDDPLVRLLNTPCRSQPNHVQQQDTDADDANASAMSGIHGQELIEGKYVAGLLGEYYNLVPSASTDNWPDDPIFRRIDSSISFDWGHGSPAGRINADNFAVRWSGQIYSPVTGMYTFAIWSDDGCMIRIGDRTLVSDWVATIVSKNVDVRLEAGWHDLRVQYMEAGGGASINVSWSKPGDLDFSPISRENYRCLK